MFRRVKCALRQEQMPIRNAMKERRQRPANEYTTHREKVGRGTTERLILIKQTYDKGKNLP